MFKLLKHSKEYRKDLFKMPTFWIGLALFGGGLGFYSETEPFISYGISIIGFILMIASKYKTIGKIEERYKDDHKNPSPPTSQP
jgi:hypothetical protein